MTINELKATRIQPKDLYKSVSTTSIEAALRDELTLKGLIDGMSRDYSMLYVQCAINDILIAHKRNNAMSEDEVKDLSERILRRRGYYTIGDMKVFADMVIGSELPSGPQGREEYELKAVDASAILSKLKAYENLRNAVYARTHPRNEDDSADITPRPLDPWKLTHDYVGNDMTDVPGWNPEAYWNSYPTQEELEGVILPRIQNTLSGVIVDVNDNF